MDPNVNDLVWAMAESVDADGRKTYFRYAEVFWSADERQLKADRVTVVWRYESTSGQPDGSTIERMQMLEEALEPIEDAGRFAQLAIVATGSGVREWTYYAESGDGFIQRLNTLLRGLAKFPIEIYVESDSSWAEYDGLLARVRTTKH